MTIGGADVEEEVEPEALGGGGCDGGFMEPIEVELEVEADALDRAGSNSGLR